MKGRASSSSFRELAAYAARRRLPLRLRTNGRRGEEHRLTEIACGELERYIAKPGGSEELDGAAAELLAELRAAEDDGA